MCVLHLFVPFSCDVSEYRAGPVQSTRPGHEGEQFGLSDEEMPSEFFSAIHQVRSNLFNGSPFFLDDRVPRLARQGADVLIGLLSRILSWQRKRRCAMNGIIILLAIVVVVLFARAGVRAVGGWWDSSCDCAV